MKRFGADGPSLHRAGWEVIPIKEKTKRPIVKDWQHGFTDQQIEQFARNGYARGSIGMLARRFPGVDIDVSDKACADALEAAVLRVLGPAPIRYGSAPKRLLMYRTDEPFTKVKVFLQAPDGSPRGPDGKDYAVEFLGDGQQYVIYGEHPDGFEYRWPGNDGPGEVDVWELTDLTLGGVTGFVEAIAEYLPEGWSVRQQTTGSAATVTVSGDAFENYRPPLEDWDADRIKADIAPHLDLAMEYDDWIRVGQALHHQFGGADEGFELWDEMFQDSPKYGGRDYGFDRWRSFKTNRGGQHVVTLASLIKQTKPVRQLAAQKERQDTVDDLIFEIELTMRPQDLQEQVAAKVAHNADLSDIDRETIAAAIQARAKELGISMPIGTVRGWCRPRVRSDWPHVNEDGNPLCTLENLRILLARLGYTVRYNVIKKSIEILIPGAAFTRDNRDNAAIAHVYSECEIVRMPTKHVAQYLITIADENQYNPVLTWIESKKWDGVSRLAAFCDTVRSESPMKDRLIRKWLIQCVAAAASPDGIANQGILTFVGPQNIGKTTWFQRLAPAELDAIFTGLTLDLKSKDSIFVGVSHWIVELGEVDATMRKSDISALKSFITQPMDKIRRPYAATESQFGRRTAFGASVNDEVYLHDPTGNRRFWSILVEGFALDHEVDMQQLWAEVLHLWRAGERWFLSKEEVGELNAHNEDFTVVDPVEERLASGFGWGPEVASWEWVTATEALVRVGVKDPSRAATITAGRALRKLNGGQRRKSNGKVLLAVPGDFEDFLG